MNSTMDSTMDICDMKFEHGSGVHLSKCYHPDCRTILVWHFSGTFNHDHLCPKVEYYCLDHNDNMPDCPDCYDVMKAKIDCWNELRTGTKTKTKTKTKKRKKRKKRKRK